MKDLLTQLALLNNDDLGGFQKNVAQDNMLLALSPALRGAQFDTRTWSPQAKLGSSFAQAFLSTALGEIGRGQVADQTRAVTSLLPQLYSDPSSVMRPEGVNEDAFELLKASAMLKNIQREAVNEQRGKDFKFDVMKELFTKKASASAEAEYAEEIARGKKRGELAALEGSLGSGSENPEHPAYKAKLDRFKGIDDIRKEFNAKTAPFEQVLKAASAVSGALKDYGKVSDQELVRYSIQMIEPGMAVREGEQAAIANSQSLPDTWKGMLAGALQGTSQLNKDVRDGIARLASRAYNSQKGSYDKAFGYYQGLAESRNLLQPGETISFLGEAPDVSDIFGNVPAAPGPEALGNDIQTQYMTLRAQGMSKEEAGKALGLK